MPILTDFYLTQLEDGILTINMQPPVSILNRSIRAQWCQRFGGSGIIQKYGYSGYIAGQSGITVTNVGQGVFNVAINSSDTSGFDPKNFPFTVEFLDNPRTCVAEGFMLLGPGGQP